MAQAAVPHDRRKRPSLAAGSIPGHSVVLSRSTGRTAFHSPDTMLYALAALFAFQLAGEALVHALALPLPGALVGTLLLLTALLWLGRLPVALEQTALTLLQNMMLLFIPTIAGVMLHFDRIAREWQPFVVAGVAGAAITYVITALTFRWMLARSPAAATTPGAST